VVNSLGLNLFHKTLPPGQLLSIVRKVVSTLRPGIAENQGALDRLPPAGADLTAGRA
jgi:hypothetical protein